MDRLSPPWPPTPSRGSRANIGNPNTGWEATSFDSSSAWIAVRIPRTVSPDETTVITVVICRGKLNVSACSGRHRSCRILHIFTRRDRFHPRAEQSEPWTSSPRWSAIAQTQQECNTYCARETDLMTRALVLSVLSSHATHVHTESEYQCNCGC